MIARQADPVDASAESGYGRVGRKILRDAAREGGL